MEKYFKQIISKLSPYINQVSKKHIILFAVTGFISLCIWLLGIKTFVKSVIFILLFIAGVFGIFLLYRAINKNKSRFKNLLCNIRAKFYDSFRINSPFSYRKRAEEKKVPSFLIFADKEQDLSGFFAASRYSFTKSQEKAKNDTNWYFANELVCIEADINLLSATNKEIKGLLQSYKAELATIAGMMLIITEDSLQDQEKFIEKCKNLKSGISAFYNLLGKRIPVTILISGDESSRNSFNFLQQSLSGDKENLCGFNFRDLHNYEQEFAKSYLAICDAMQNRIVKQLHMGANLLEKINLITLPSRVATSFSKLEDAMKVLYAPSIYHEDLVFQGIYYSLLNKSAKEELFTQNLLPKLLQQSPYLLCKTTKKSKQDKYLLHAGYSLSLVLFLGASSSLIHAYMQQSKLLDRGMAAWENLPKIKGRVAAKIDVVALEGLAEHTYELRHLKEIYPWYNRLGMGQASRHKGRYEALLAHFLDRNLYYPVVGELENRLLSLHHKFIKSDAHNQDKLRGEYYTILKQYLMLFYPNMLDVNLIKNEFLQFLAHHDNEPYLEEVVKVYAEYLQSLDYAKMPKLKKINTALVKKSRDALFVSGGIANAYANMIYENQNKGEFDFFLNHQILFLQSTKSIPWIYTRLGYENYISKLIENMSQTSVQYDWVLKAPLHNLETGKSTQFFMAANNAEQEKTNALLTKQYFTDYLNLWADFIANTSVQSFSSITDALQQLRELSQEAGPLTDYFAEINTNFALADFVDKRNLQNIPQSLSKSFTKIAEATDFKQNKALSFYLESLMAVEQELERASLSGDSSLHEELVVDLLLGKGKEHALYKAMLMLEKVTTPIADLHMRQGLKQMLLSPIQKTYAALLDDVVKNLNKEWQDNIVGEFERRLFYQFPFNKSGQDASLADFGAFFNPHDGALSSFIKRISAFVKLDASHYTKRKWLGVSAPIADSFITQLLRLQKLTKSLYNNNNNDVSFKYGVYILPTRGTKEILFGSNGQSYPYRNGPEEWAFFNWPQQDNIDNETYLRITTSRDEYMAKSSQGVWGFFHLLQNANAIKRTDKGYLCEWIYTDNGKRIPVQAYIKPKTKEDLIAILLLDKFTLQKNMQAS